MNAGLALLPEPAWELLPEQARDAQALTLELIATATRQLDTLKIDGGDARQGHALSELDAELQKIIAELERRFKAATAQLEEELKKWRIIYGEPKLRASDLRARVRAKLTAWKSASDAHKQRERERAEAELLRLAPALEAAQQAAASPDAPAEARVEAQARVAEVAPAFDAALVRAEDAVPVRAVRGATATTSFREEWTFEIDAAADVPREYCAPVASLIRAAVGRGVRQIPGVRIYSEQRPTTRRPR